MKAKLSTRVTGIIDVSSNFAQIVSADDQEVVYDVFYDVKKTQAFIHKAFVVKIEVLSGVPVAPRHALSRGKQPNAIVSGVINKATENKNISRSNLDLVISEYYDDIGKYVNNEEVQDRLRSVKRGTVFRPLTAVKQIKLRSIADIVATGFHAEIQVGQRAKIEPQESDSSLREALIKNLFQRKEPAGALTRAHVGSNVSTHNSLHGTGKIKKKTYHPDDVDLKNILFSGPANQPKSIINLSKLQPAVIVTEQNDDTITAHRRIRILRSQVNRLTDIFFKFDVISKQEIALESVTRKVRFADEIHILNTPTIPPVVGNVSFSSRGLALLDVKQMDRKATKVQVFRKSVSPNIPFADHVYDFVGEYEARHSGGFRKIPVPVSGLISQIFRVVPVGPTGILGAEFTAVVASPKRIPNLSKQTRSHRAVSCIITAHASGSGILVEVRNIEFGPISARILRKNKTLHERVFSPIVGHESFLSLSGTTTISVTDTNVNRFHVYEYTAEFVYKFGDLSQFGQAVIEFIPLTVHAVDTKIANFQQLNSFGKLDVKFNMETQIKPTHHNKVKNMTERQGQGKIYEEDVKNKKTELNPLVAHQVVRINLKTGEREHLGTFTEGEFHDSKISQIKSVQPLNSNHSYRYETSTLLRQAHTLFLGTKTPITNSLGKVHLSQPWKFQHPVAAHFGNIPSINSLKFRYAKDDFQFGHVGDLIIKDVIFNSSQSGLSTVSVDRVDRNTVTIKWSVTGDHKLYDHFLVMREIMGVRSLIGKCHSHFTEQNYVFNHHLTQDDHGAVSFIIKPILNSYAEGAEKISNEIEITEL